MTTGALMDDNIARRHRFGAQWKLIEGEPDYTVRVRMDDETMTYFDRRKLWPVAFLVVVVVLLLGAGVWAVLR